jgi:hypothetical protein
MLILYRFSLPLIRLIINEGLEIGSQIPYIRRAQAAGYAVIVTNTNLNDYQSPKFLRRNAIHPIRVGHCSFICFH